MYCSSFLRIIPLIVVVVATFVGAGGGGRMEPPAETGCVYKMGGYFG